MSPTPHPPLPSGPREQLSECSSCVCGSVHGPLGASNPVTFRNERGSCLFPEESGGRGGPPGAVTGMRKEGQQPQRAGRRWNSHAEKQPTSASLFIVAFCSWKEIFL